MKKGNKEEEGTYTGSHVDEGEGNKEGPRVTVREKKRKHDDRAINNTGEKGDRLQHSAQMLNRYQFNAVQSPCLQAGLW